MKVVTCASVTKSDTIIIVTVSVILPLSLSLRTSFFEQTFFPEHMVAWCQETNHAILPSQLLQVRTAHTRCSLAALLNTQTVSFSESAPATYILYNQAGIPHLWPLDSVSHQSLQ